MTARVFSVLLSLLIGATLCAAPRKAPSNAKSSSQKLAAIDSQLQAVFNKADENSDGYLDAVELAHSFRGAKAKAAPPAFDEKGNLTAAAKQAATKYPDLVFLEAVDKDSDGQVSWNEFKTYGETAAQAFQAQAAQRQKAIQAAYARAMRNLRSPQRRTSRMRSYRSRGHYSKGNQQAQRATQQRTAQRAVQQRMAQAKKALQQQQRAMQQRIAQAQRAAQAAQKKRAEAARQAARRR